MAFDFEKEVDERTPYDFSETVENLIRTKFSTICDALQFDGRNKIAETAIEKNGYYREGFFMLHPFYYLREQFSINPLVKNGIIFTTVGADADLNSLSINWTNRETSSEMIEHMPIVVFKNHRGDICIPDTATDLSKEFHCLNDTYEFIGVYKAEKLQNNPHYKLTKLFDRFYFNTYNANSK